MALSLVLPLRAPLPGATDLSATLIAHPTTACSDGQMEQTFSPDAGSPASTILHADVIVVGAGLAGLVAATEAADAARTVLLIDQEG